MVFSPPQCALLFSISYTFPTFASLSFLENLVALLSNHGYRDHNVLSNRFFHSKAPQICEVGNPLPYHCSSFVYITTSYHCLCCSLQIGYVCRHSTLVVCTVFYVHIIDLLPSCRPFCCHPSSAIFVVQKHDFQ